MSELLIRMHLGLGDHLVCNAIVRACARQHSQVVVLCKPHNAATLTFLWRDVPQVEVFSAADDADADDATRYAQRAGFAILGLGSRKHHAFGSETFHVEQWDQEFYRQAGIPFEQRWSGFVCVRQPSRELPAPRKPFILLHEDVKRGFLLDRSRIASKLPVVSLDPSLSPNLFDWWGHFEAARELHLMESSPAILADSLPSLAAKRKVIHAYARKSIPPTYHLDWTILR